MQIKDLLKKDFQKVFPTILGDEEGKISISDLMDTSHDIIVSRIQDLNEGINQEEKSEIIFYLELVESSELDIEYDAHFHYLLKRFAEKYPEQKSFRFCEFRYVLNTLSNNKDSTQDFLTRFYDKILADHSLMNLADFIQESGFGNSLILLNEVSDEIVDMLKGAISHYPQKIILLWITAILLRVQGKHKEVIKYNKLFLEKLQESGTNGIYDLDYVDEESELMVSYQLADLYYQIGDNSNSMNYCDIVLSKDQGKESNIYYDALIIKIRIHMSYNDYDAFQNDYNELLEVVTEKELRENYKDVIDYKPK
ncbi:MAG: hypothetical protein JW973_11195 [Bacteroidales bacterium]|nr:hypothetical protein [Bacteroidales bacterium]